MEVAIVNLDVMTANIPGAIHIDALHTELKSPSNLCTPICYTSTKLIVILCAFDLSKLGIQEEITTTQIEYCQIQIWGIQYIISCLLNLIRLTYFMP